VFALVLAVPSAAIDLLADPGRFAAWNLVGFGLNAILYLYVFLLMLRRIFRPQTVSVELIVLAVTCYLMIGFIWTLAYISIEALNPGSFTLEADGDPFWVQLNYFSFVTLTTLGYGDIAPVAPLARSLAMFEAIIGPLFIGILIARLISEFDPRRGRSA
jgi:hypothetical protein